ncbi:cytochrome P450 [Streptomyces sp. P1-3]|uniref:cytochrome P450 n=1 Tax=Streptomyces sp. P1-3 TaxID=3421658 RepID=UPI003D369E9D
MTTTTTPGPIPLAPGALPLLGHLVPLLRDPWSFIDALTACDGLVEVRVGPAKAIVVCDAELTRRVLLNDRIFDKGGPLYARARDALGANVITVRHDEHRPRRHVSQPAFHRPQIEAYAKIMSEQIEIVTGKWRDGGVVNVLVDMHSIAARVAVATMFGSALSPAELGQISHDFMVVAESIYKRMFMPWGLTRLPLATNRRYNRSLARLQRTVRRIIAEYRASETDRGDLLSILLHADYNGRELTDSEVENDVIAFFLAGVETTSASLSWPQHLLSQHPEVEARLHAEADRVLDGRIATYDDLPKLEMTTRILTETLRVYPPVWMSMRTTTADSELGGRPIPAGTTVVFSPYLIHHRADTYHHPEIFAPDRWEGEAAERLRRAAFIPFAIGARQCIGDTFAFVEGRLVLASIASRWRLVPAMHRAVTPALGSVLHPKELRMRAIARR